MTINKILKNLKKKKNFKKVLVVGEVFEDIFTEVRIVKISPEAPVMVINPIKDHKNTYLGGAGNVLKNLLSANLDARLISLAEKNKLKYVNSKIQKKIDLIIDNKYQNIKKIRYVSNNKHIIRVDDEKKFNFPENKNKTLYKILKKYIKNTDYYILSDYNKGFLTDSNIPEIIDIIKKKENTKIFVDSKRSNLEIFKNVYLIKINNLEACEYFDIKDVYKISNYPKIFNFLKKNKIENIIITTGKNGAILFKKNKFYNLTSREQKKVYDVSGAGDTFLSYLVYAEMNGLEIKKAISVANRASFLAISSYGISSVKKNDL